MKVSIQIPGLEAKIRSMQKKFDRKERLIKVVVLKTAINIEGNAKAIVPVLTGRLRGSLGHTFSHNKVEAEVGTNVLYAPFVEFKQPYLKPAVFKEEAKFFSEIQNIIRRG